MTSVTEGYNVRVLGIYRDFLETQVVVDDFVHLDSDEAKDRSLEPNLDIYSLPANREEDFLDFEVIAVDEVDLDENIGFSFVDRRVETLESIEAKLMQAFHVSETVLSFEARASNGNTQKLLIAFTTAQRRIRELFNEMREQRGFYSSHIEVQEPAILERFPGDEAQYTEDEDYLALSQDLSRIATDKEDIEERYEPALQRLISEIDAILVRY